MMQISKKLSRSLIKNQDEEKKEPQQMSIRENELSDSEPKDFVTREQLEFIIKSWDEKISGVQEQMQEEMKSKDQEIDTLKSQLETMHKNYQSLEKEKTTKQSMYPQRPVSQMTNLPSLNMDQSMRMSKIDKSEEDGWDNNNNDSQITYFNVVA